MRFDTDGAHSWPLGRWVHSDNTWCMCLCPRDGLMRTYPKASQVREQVPGRSSCCRQACNHSLSPDSSRPQLSPMNTRRFSALPGSNFYRCFLVFVFFLAGFSLNSEHVWSHSMRAYQRGVRPATHETLMRHNPRGLTEPEVKFIFHLKR